jgi:hypothetical protein
MRHLTMSPRTCGPASRPIGPDVREFCRMLVGGGEKRFDFALLAAGYDAGGKSPRVATEPTKKLGGNIALTQGSAVGPEHRRGVFEGANGGVVIYYILPACYLCCL